MRSVHPKQERPKEATQATRKPEKTGERDFWEPRAQTVCAQRSARGPELAVGSAACRFPILSGLLRSAFLRSRLSGAPCFKFQLSPTPDGIHW